MPQSGVYTVDKWKAKRDEKGKGPGKGAVSGVSMGDELTKYHKEYAKGPAEGLAAAKKLQPKLVKYKKEIAKKFPDFATKVVEKQLEYFLGEDVKVFNNMIAAGPEYENAIKVAKANWAGMKAKLKGDDKTPFGKKDYATLGAMLEKAGAQLERLDTWTGTRDAEWKALKALGYQLVGAKDDFVLGPAFAKKLDDALS